MDSKQTELITEEFVIQGLLKEVLRAESVFTIEGLGTEFKIVDLMESKIRDSSQNKKVLVRLLNSNTFPEGICIVRGGFYRSLVQFETTVIEGAGPKLFWVEVPKLLTLFNYRTSDRSPVKPSLRKACPILMVTNGMHCEGTFTIEDTSLEGIGGILQVPTGFPCGATTEVRGRLYLSEGELELNGSLIRVNAVDEIKFGYDAYSVGIKQALPEEREKGRETRAHARYKIRHELSLVPLIHPDHTFKVDLVDISIGGFSGFLIAGSVLPAFPIGTVFKFPGKSAKIVLTNFSEDIYRFQIVSRSESEAIEWLRTMTPVLYPGAQCSISDARDLYKIFLQAGAISTQYLKRHELYDDSLVNEHSNIEDESGYLHRWYVRGKDKSVEAHISAIRVSNNCWNIGDIAKITGSTVDGKILVMKFNQSFGTMAQSIVPHPKVMITWVKGHPFWDKWKTHLLSENPKLIYDQQTVRYWRTNQVIHGCEPGNDSIVNRIEANQFQLIEKISEMLSSCGILAFAKVVSDFDEGHFGSGRLASLAVGFERYYFELTLKSFSYLVVLTKTPCGNSQTRVGDSALVYPLQRNFLSSKDGEVLNKSIFKISSNMGIVLPSIRMITPRVGFGFEDAGSDMDCIVLWPSALGTFNEYNV